MLSKKRIATGVDTWIRDVVPISPAFSDTESIIAYAVDRVRRARQGTQEIGSHAVDATRRKRSGRGEVRSMVEVPRHSVIQMRRSIENAIDTKKDSSCVHHAMNTHRSFASRKFTHASP
jgi:hypothetical protein